MRDSERTRQSYLDELKGLFCQYYGYNEELIGVFMQLFSPSEVIKSAKELLKQLYTD